MSDKANTVSATEAQCNSLSQRREHGRGAQSIYIDVATQSMHCYEYNSLVQRFVVSTSKHGVGQENGSYQTPLGRHTIRAKIGGQQPPGAVFVGRRPTGEVWSDTLDEQFPQRDWILSRILWLCGSERGLNRLGSVDSMRRYIYIHGTSDTQPMGQPASHGCIRMTNSDVIELFTWANIGTVVSIKDSASCQLLAGADSSSRESAGSTGSLKKTV